MLHKQDAPSTRGSTAISNGHTAFLRRPTTPRPPSDGLTTTLSMAELLAALPLVTLPVSTVRSPRPAPLDFFEEPDTTALLARAPAPQTTPEFYPMQPPTTEIPDIEALLSAQVLMHFSNTAVTVSMRMANTDPDHMETDAAAGKAHGWDRGKSLAGKKNGPRR